MADKIEWGGTPGPWEVADSKLRSQTRLYDWAPDVMDEGEDDADYRQSIIDLHGAVGGKPIDLRAIAEVPAMVVALRSVEADWGEIFDSPTEPMNGGDAVEWICHFIERVRPILARIDGGEG